jgi:hypothetical protein
MPNRDATRSTLARSGDGGGGVTVEALSEVGAVLI